MQKATLKPKTQEDLQWVQNAYKAGVRLIAIFKLQKFLRRKKIFENYRSRTDYFRKANTVRSLPGVGPGQVSK